MKKIKFNFVSLLFLFLTISVLISDFIEYFIKVNYVIEILIGFLFSFIILFLLRNKYKLEVQIEKSDLIFALPFLIFLGLTVFFPDRMYDTLNYHLLNQEKPFINRINNYYFPNSILQSFNYAFPDRLFYVFRYFLGYRFGNILNYILLIGIYYNVKFILKKILNSSNVINSLNSTLIVFSLSIIDIVDTYYIDIISLFLILEIFKIILEPMDSLDIYYYFAFLLGVSITVKISNIFFICILCLLMLLKNYNYILKEIKIKRILYCFVILIIPMSLYVYYTWKSTGNPVFPFYNKIFKSPYFPNINWTDTRFGPNGIIEKIIWPVIAFLEPKRSIDVAIIEPIIMFGYIMSYAYIFISIILKLKKKKLNYFLFNTCILDIILNIIWSTFMLGYIRYALFLLILDGIIVYACLYEAIKMKKIFLTLGIVPMCIINIGYSYQKIRTSSGYATYNNIIANGMHSLKYNILELKSLNVKKIKLPNNSVWGVTDLYSGYMNMLNNNVPIVYINMEEKFKSLLNYDLTSKENSKRMTGLLEKQNDLLKNKKIYTIVDSYEIDKLSTYLNISGYKIVDFYEIYQNNFLNINNIIYIFEIEQTNEYINNFSYKSSYETGLNCNEIYIGLSKEMEGLDFDEIYLQVENKKKILYKEKLKSGNYNLKKYNINSEDVSVFVVDKNNNKVDWIKLIIIGSN